tara:strand:- start:1768 stop:2859 length:1092 start_codon:yes stop_codon:yes gene_type:complete
MKKEVIIFMPSIEGGGVEKNLFIVVNYLAKKINNISLITTSFQYRGKFNKKINLIFPKNKFWENLGRRFKYFICLFILFQNLLKNKNSVVFAFQANLYCIIICKLLSIKIIIRSNSAPEGWSKNIIKQYLYKVIIKKADKIIVNSYDFKNSMKKKFGVDPIVIYNPLNKSEIVKKSKYKIKNIFPKKKLKIVSIGRLVEQKDQITLLKSLNFLKNKINFYLVLIGRGDLKQKLVDYTKSNNLNNKVKFVNFKNNPYPYIKQADLFILTSKYEGLPNVLLESIALKKFIISSDCPTGPKEILLNGKCGYLFPVGDYKKLSRKILLFKKNSNKNKKIVNIAFKTLNRFDLNYNLKKYFNLITPFI